MREKGILECTNDKIAPQLIPGGHAVQQRFRCVFLHACHRGKRNAHAAQCPRAELITTMSSMNVAWEMALADACKERGEEERKEAEDGTYGRMQ